MWAEFYDYRTPCINFCHRWVCFVKFNLRKKRINNFPQGNCSYHSAGIILNCPRQETFKMVLSKLYSEIQTRSNRAPNLMKKKPIWDANLVGKYNTKAVCNDQRKHFRQICRSSVWRLDDKEKFLLLLLTHMDAKLLVFSAQVQSGKLWLFDFSFRMVRFPTIW